VSRLERVVHGVQQHEPGEHPAAGTFRERYG